MNKEQDTSAGTRPVGQSLTRNGRGDSPTKIESLRRPFTDAPMLSATTSNNHSLFSFGRNGEIGDTTTGSFDFLPSVSFDDLQSSLESASTDFKLNQFPSPTGQGSILSKERPPDTMVERSNITHNGANTRVAIQPPPPATRPSRSGSILRRPSTSNRQSSVSSIVSNNSSALGVSSSGTTGPVAIRSRRQSHYPPVSNTNIVKPPRKSMGPGVLDGDYETRTAQRGRPGLASERGGLDSTRSSIDGGVRIIGDTSRSLTSSRASKVRSVQPPPPPTPRTSQTTLSADTSTLTPDHSRVSLAFPRSPRGSMRASNPPSSGKRVSAMPGVSHATHATGLGARTISPTDTIRMKRLSNMNDVLSQPLPPHLPALSTETRTSSRSPSMLPRKASTPSSSRTTPDLNRKSYSSGLSVGSTTSYNTVRTSTGSIQPRIPQSASSRLPAPKSLNLHSAASAGEEDEDVPPVPAIPKVYESPKDLPGESSLLDKRKSSVAFDTSSINSASTGSVSGVQQGGEPATKIRRKQSERKSIHTSKLELDKKGVGAQLRKNLQPLNLPPIHLGPLSTPTAAKIAALHERSSEKTSSPTPGRQISKTPSTPMTASKSTFFSRNLAEEKTELGSMRSSSSVHHAGFDTPSAADTTSSSESLMAPGLGKNRELRSGMSPFLSSSVPKGGGSLEQNMVVRSKTGGDYTLPLDTNVDELPAKPVGPRAAPPPPSKPIKPVTSKSPPPLSVSDEPPTPSSISSLRRKLSLSWKRSASKNSGSHPPGDKDAQNHNARKESMPPPRLPISATVNTLSTAQAPSPAHSSKPSGTTTYLESRRRKSSASSLNAFASQDRSRSDSIGAKKDATLDTVAERSGHAVNSSAAQKLLRPRASMGTMRAHDVWTQELDKDDLVAEDEMRRLGERRKETELAARTLDALRKRATAKDRVSPQEAIEIAVLNVYERGEIVDYKDVYFCGTQHAKKVVGDVQSDLLNFGYDDERGDYSIVPGDHLAYRYEIIDVLGKGSFGQVVRCIDHKTGVLVAVKIIRNKKRFHQQALVEVNILQKLREWDPKNKHSMVNFTQSFYFRGHLCISTELLDMNLYEFIKSNAFRGFSLKLIRRFTKQLLSSLNLLKQHKVIHCDLKPENILLHHPLHSEIKVIDFGSSCFENEKVYTYIQSRFYRSPEVILGMTYGMPIDMWSLGCILAELYTGVPIFPGENEQEQLACIMEVFGPPEKHLIEKSTRKKIFFDSMGKPRLTVSSKGRRRRPSSKTLQQVLKCDDEPFLDFLARCLRWDPDRRMKPDDAIRHEFITGQKSSVPVARGSVRDSSPAKRPANSSTAPRPLPEPPAAAKASSISLRPREAAGGSGVSPLKSSSGLVSRRASNVTSTLNISSSSGLGAKRTASTAMLPAATAVQNLTASAAVGASGLPRAAVRSVSGKSDLAAAGATAAMSRRV